MVVDERLCVTFENTTNIKRVVLLADKENTAYEDLLPQIVEYLHG